MTSGIERVNDYLNHTYEIFIETTISELDERFNKHQKNIVYIINLLPSIIVDKTLMNMKHVFEFYEIDLPSKNVDVIKAEFEL
jgi:hypothetical protein